MKRSKLKIILTVSLALILAVFLSGISLILYWNNVNEKNLKLGNKIAAELVIKTTENKNKLKDALDKKYNLEQNNEVEIIVTKIGSKHDILVNIYHRPMGPFTVFSQKRNEWFYEE
jgi:hypothetical protein